MKNLAAAFLLAAATLASATDYDYGTWKVTTMELLWLGSKYAGYPAGYMFDGNPKTAWVFKGNKNDARFKSETTGAGNIFEFTVHTSKPTLISGLRILNGYAKDEATWKRNNRIKRLKVWTFDLKQEKNRLLADVTMPDDMTTKTISFTPIRTDHITLESVNFYLGKDDDFCISELQLVSSGKPLRFQTSRMFVLNAGGGCCCGGTSYAATQHGTRLMKFDTGEEGGACLISKDGRYIAGLKVGSKGNNQLLIYDTASAKVVQTKTIRTKEPNELQLEWRGHTLVDVFDYSRHGYRTLVRLK